MNEEIEKKTRRPERAATSSEYALGHKKPTSDPLLCFFLDPQRFHLSQPGLDILYILFSRTMIPRLAAMIECLPIRARVPRHNAALADEMLYEIRLSGDRRSPSPQKMFLADDSSQDQESFLTTILSAQAA